MNPYARARARGSAPRPARRSQHLRHREPRPRLCPGLDPGQHRVRRASQEPALDRAWVAAEQRGGGGGQRRGGPPQRGQAAEKRVVVVPGGEGAGRGWTGCGVLRQATVLSYG